MIKVLVADDSATVRAFLVHLLGSDPEIEVIGAVSNGMEVLDFLREQRPDVITMDIDMPELDGLETTRRIMETDPHPVVIVSGLTDRERTGTFTALEAGALAIVLRPHGIGHSAFEETAEELLGTVKAMAGVKLVRRWPKVAGSQRRARIAASPPHEEHSRVRIVGIGASTGGPAVLKTILGGLPEDFSLPIVLVQHMSHGFLEGFADWLSSVTGRIVKIAVDGEKLQPGRVYLAPEKVQLEVTPEGAARTTAECTEETHCPSVSRLLLSLAESYGRAAVGVVLTGMGRDGADAMRVLRHQGAVTIAQSAETCVVNGMPQEAVRAGGAEYVLPPEKISAMLRDLAEGKPQQLRG
jgi:two-component system, chemotaxis family, protein-glutamate methylesterase/glutaminase